MMTALLLEPGCLGQNPVDRAWPKSSDANTRPSAAHVRTKPTRAATGQVPKLARHHGNAARRASSLMTRPSKLDGALRNGKPRRP